jgi:hypothetical protein
MVGDEAEQKVAKYVDTYVGGDLMRVIGSGQGKYVM